MSWKFFPAHAPGQAAMAPSSMLLVWSGTMEFSVGMWMTPWPWQAGHMPSGVLGEKESE